ncbi:hypothetical protein [Thermaerobacter subterraneus]|uniref:DUF1232 domain-containing protein n=1 Tax=Thermaerobacter subterraneus DSM 13965 TaxID=867903 RepID=K6PS22_9FIRM|nr:hypothetical protein [Thermaerobacter subterraneus]EKP95757.1 hypothetical protein ThesuDRAFT_01517 [Thermaerobacter subterraneus DSM 13965]
MQRWRGTRPRPGWREWVEIVRLLKDPQAGTASRLAVLLAALYLVWPADLLPGLPPASWLDDATVLWLAYLFLRRQLERRRQGDRRGGRGPGRAGGPDPAGG